MKKIRLLSLLGLGLVALASCGGTTDGFDSSRNITLYSRDTDSGTRDGYFSNIGLKDAATDNGPLKTVSIVESNGSMIQAVSNDIYGVGYISLSTLENSDEIKGLSYNEVEPTTANVLNGTYSLTRNFNYIVRNEGDYSSTEKEAVVDAFVDYMFSFEGRSIMSTQHGILEIPTSTSRWSTLAESHPIMQRTDLNLTINVGGSTSVSSMAQALTSAFKELFASGSNITFAHNHSGSGAAYTGTQVTAKDASGELDVAFLSRELSSSEPATEGTHGFMCIDAIVTIVNSENTLENVTQEDLYNMYASDGTYTKWSDLID